MPIIKARSSSLTDSVDLRGTPTAPTANAGTTTTQVATTSFVSTAVSDLIDSAPGVLDTLNELAAAINDDASFATTVTNSIATKVALAGDTMTGFLSLHADPSSNMHAATKQYVDAATLAITISTTDDVAEGSTNLYYTDARVRSAVALTSDNTSVLDYDSATGSFTYNHPTSDGILEGSTNQYFTDARARGAISLTSDDSTILSYSSATGEFTFSKQDTDKVTEGSTNLYFTTARARQSISAGSNISYDSATGIISSTAAVDSVNGQTGTVVLDTDNISEGSSNLYFTNARAAGAISLTTDDQNVLSYNSGTGTLTFAIPSTDGIAEGSTNLYFTDARARGAVSVDGDLTYNSGTGVIGFALSDHDTDDLDEGATNLYYTDTRARLAVSLTSDDLNTLSYNAATGAFTYNAPDSDSVFEGTINVYFTDSRARDALSVTDNGGDGSLSYDSATGVITYTGPSASEVRAHFSATDAGGDGSFSYDSATGVFTYTGPSTAEVRAHFSDGVGVSFDSGTGEISLDFNEFDTDDISEGANNLYYTDARVRSAVTGGTGVTVNSTSGVISIGQSVGTSDAVTFAGVTVNGNLTVTGTTTTVNTETIELADNIIVLNSNATGAPSEDAGIEIERGDSTNVSLVWDEANDRWTIGSETFYAGAFTATGTITANNFVGSFEGQVDDISNFSTTDLAEGTNLYFTDARARAAVSANDAGGDGSFAYDDQTGVFTYTGPSASETRAHFTASTVSGDGTLSYDSASGAFSFAGPTNTEYRGAVSASDAGGDGSFSYDSATGVFTYTGPSAAETRAHFSATGDLSYNSGTGVFDFALSNHNTDDLGEGSTNLYYTDTRARLAVSMTTDDAAVLSYDNTTGEFTFSLGDVNTDKVVEGSTNLYFTTARARNAISAGSNISYDAATGIISSSAAVDSVNGQTGVVVVGTDDVAEGSTNLYFTDARARSAVSLTTDDANILAYDSGTGVFTFVTPDTDSIAEGSVNLYYTDARADGRIAVASIRDLADVDSVESLDDGYTLVWSSSAQKFVPQSVTVSTTTTNFTANGTDTSFELAFEVDAIENTTVFINGLYQAPTYSYTLSTTSGLTSIVFDTAPEANDIITVRAISGATLNAQGVLNENSQVDGGSF